MHGSSSRRDLVMLVVVSLSLACTTPPDQPASPASLAGLRASRITLAPMNMALPLPDHLASTARLASVALLTRLQQSGKTIEPLTTNISRQLWIEAATEVRRSGTSRNFENAARIFATRIADSDPTHITIIPSLYLQNARVDAKAVARWDGANQDVGYVGQTRWEIEPPALTTIPAVSLLVYVFDANGDVIHVKRTGLELLQHLIIEVASSKGRDKRSWVLVDNATPLADENRTAAAIRHALYPFLAKTAE